jgi:hypothetical protein
MSTDLQKYSTENQLDTIRRYAEQRGFTIVRVFEDSGRSGLRMDGRDGLQSLMLEVQSGAAGFQAILVYDVSRWGRFQDADEGAYHEHLCSRAGIGDTLGTADRLEAHHLQHEATVQPIIAAEPIPPSDLTAIIPEEDSSALERSTNDQKQLSESKNLN